MNDRKDIVEHVHPSRRDYAEEEAIDWWRNLHAWPKRRLYGTLLLSQEEGIKVAAMRPTCDVCDRLVDMFEQLLDGRDIVLTVRCHGESETMRIGLDQILDLIAAGVPGGRAFVRLRIGETRKLR